MKRLLSGLLAASVAAAMLPVSACAADYTTSNATLIQFNSSSASATGKYSGYKIDGTSVSITEAGTYVFSGTCADGLITVKKEVSGVTLVLDGLTLTSKRTAPITINKSASATLLAASGSRNSLSDTKDSNDENAAIKVKSGASLSLGGTGSLTVDGNAKNGIKGAAESAISVDDLTLTIKAENDGLSGDNTVAIEGGTLNITAGGDAVKASPDTDDETDPDTVSKGDVTISGGKITLNAAEDGVQADGNLTVTGGTFDVTANGGHTTTLNDDDASCKGLKAGKTLSVTGGTFDVDSADDALHANTVTVMGGSLTLATGDDGIHADDALTVGTKGNASTTTPKINVTNSYEGLEGTTVTVYSGDIDVVSSDDGVNAANSDISGRSDKFAINIAGGDLYINAGSDGLDSNNDINMTGGKVEVYGADAMMDAAIDYDGTFTLSGGTLFGAGMTPTAGTQAYVAVGETSPTGGGDMGGPGGMNGSQDGTTPPTPPTGDNSNGTTPPTPPTGDSSNGTTPPTLPTGDTSGTRPTRPDNNGNGGNGGGAPMNRESTIGIKEGSVITVQDSSGKTLYTATALGSMSSVVFSSADIKEGETYTVLVDGTSVGSAQAVRGTTSNSSHNANGGMGGNGSGAIGGSSSGSSSGSGAAAGGNIADFQDIALGAWYANAVQYVYDKKLMSGQTTNTFAPDSPMTRAMLAAVLYRYAGSPAVNGNAPFGDVASDVYYTSAAAWASDKGVISGTAASTFSPNTNITREQLAAMLYRYVGSPAVSGDLSAFTDASAVSDYAKDAVSWCVSKGILRGTSSTTLSPHSTATRAQVASILQRFAAL